MSGYKYFRYFNYSPGGEPPPDYPHDPETPDTPDTPDDPSDDCCFKCFDGIYVDQIPGYAQGNLQVLGHIEGDACIRWIDVEPCPEEEDADGTSSDSL